MIAVALAACLGSLLAGPTAPDASTSAAPPGMVAYRGGWARPDEIIDREAGDPRLTAARAEYADRRATAPETAEGQRSLARWCDGAGLKAEALAHWNAVTRIDPDDEAAQSRLGRRRHGGAWMSGPEIEAEDGDARAQARADRSWGPKVAAWRLELTEPATRDAAAKALGAIRDPRAVPALRRSFADRGPWEQGWAIRLLGPIDAPASTRELAGLSVFGIDEPIRGAALARLARRDPRGFVGLLIRWLRDPVRYTPEPVAGGPEATAGLRIEGSAAIVERLYRADPAATGTPGPFAAFNAGNRRGPAAQDPARAAVLARRQQDIRAIELGNVPIELANERIERALIRTTGLDLGQDGKAWSAWWTNENGYVSEGAEASTPKPVITQTVPVAYVSPPPPASIPPAVGVRHACFAAGTPVLTRVGPRPIEDLRVGDQVLTAEQATGEVEFRPILAVFHNRPASTLRIRLGADEITATPIHRFWLVARGWAMARDLKVGDRVRTLDGPATVEAVTPSAVQPVFNLEVADGHSFFVGRGRALVHDNSLVGPIFRPFDAGE